MKLNENSINNLEQKVRKTFFQRIRSNSGTSYIAKSIVALGLIASIGMSYLVSGCDMGSTGGVTGGEYSDILQPEEDTTNNNNQDIIVPKHDIKTTGVIYYEDKDGDGYGNANGQKWMDNQPPGFVPVAGDCNDNDPTIYPGAPELCDGIIQNCNNTIPDVGLTRPCSNNCGSGLEECIGGLWVNCDAPLPQEEVKDGIDNDCDGVIDEGLCIKKSLVYGGSSWDVGHDIKATDDGGYIIAGATESKGNGNRDAWIIKVDADLKIEWEKTYGGTEFDEVFSIQKTSDLGYILAGSTSSQEYESNVGWIIKLDGNGDKEWEYFNGNSADWINSIIETQDGNYVAVGETGSKVEGEGQTADIWLMMLDNYGELLWEKTFNKTSFDTANTVIESEDGGYIIGGTITPTNIIGEFKGWVIKTNNLGELQWDKIYGAVESGGCEKIESIIQTEDDGYMIISSLESDLKIVKTDYLGNYEWSKTYGDIGIENGLDIQQTSDGGYIAVGYTDSKGKGELDAWILKLDMLGNLEWDQTFGGTGKDKFRKVIEVNEGKYVAVGYQATSDNDNEIMVRLLEESQLCE